MNKITKIFSKLCFGLLLINSAVCIANTYVFVSFTMNDEAIKAYFVEASKIGATLVMRGLIDDSFIATKAKLDELNIAYDINPELFEKYNVRQVPTIIDVQKDSIKQITGHIPLTEALRIFAEEKP